MIGWQKKKQQWAALKKLNIEKAASSSESKPFVSLSNFQKDMRLNDEELKELEKEIENSSSSSFISDCDFKVVQDPIPQEGQWLKENSSLNDEDNQMQTDHQIVT